MITPLDAHLEAIATTPPPGHRPDWTSMVQAITGLVTCFALACGLVWWLAESYSQLGAIKFQFEQLRNDIKSYNVEITKRLDDHETRLRALEMRKP